MNQMPEDDQGGSGQTGKERPPRDKWDYISILARPIAASLTALAIGLLGWWGQSVISEREVELTKRERSAQNYSLYTELLSRREEAESALRKDMFQAILNQILTKSDKGESSENVSGMMLKIELLALNFGESLSLSPLFLETDRAIDALQSKGSPVWRIEQDVFRSRLQSLAKRVSSWQLSALTSGSGSRVSQSGNVIEIDVPIDEVTGLGRYVWPDAYIGAESSSLKEQGFSDEDVRAWKNQVGTLGVEDIMRSYSISFSGANTERKTIRVELKIAEVGKNVLNPRPVEMEFDLNFFNFPMVDNTRLSGNQRFALVMEDFNLKKGFIKITGICFPGLYATQRDKPFLDEVIDKLRKSGWTDGEMSDEENQLQEAGSGAQ